MIVIIDNYDSFSYNLYQMIGAIDNDVRVVRNDVVTPEEVLAMKPMAIVLSPGPGRPCDAGICEDMIRVAKGKVPILGVCLGHQAICEVFGAIVTYASHLMHGKSSMTTLDTGCPLFTNLPKTIQVGRYHSLAADPVTMPHCLKVVAQTVAGEVMAVQHTEYEIYGLQFHPESILTPEGSSMLKNFIKLCRRNEE
jgi:anthranilate synthase component 2